jgi:cytochrome c556
MKRASEELGFSTKEQAIALRNLAAGEFYAFGPAISAEVSKITIGAVETTHPKAGSRIYTASPIPPTERIKKILSELKDLPEAAAEEARTVEALQQQLATLKRQLAQKPQGTEISVPSKEMIASAVKNAVQSKQKAFEQEKNQLETRIASLTTALQGVAKAIAPVLEVPRPIQTTNQKPVPNMTANPTPEITISQGAAVILQVLRNHSPMVFSKTLLIEQLPSAVRANGFGLYLSLLEHKGLIRIEHNRVMLTNAGKEPSSQQLQELAVAEKTIEMWKSKLKPGAQRMFDVLADVYPKPLTKKEIGMKTGLSYTSGTFGKYYRLLKDNRLIVVTGEQIRASESLFL